MTQTLTRPRGTTAPTSESQGTYRRLMFPQADFKVDASNGDGIIEAIVAVFNNVDHGGERILPGFFAESIAKRRTAEGKLRVKGVWSHDWFSPVAITLDAKELLPGDAALPERLKALGGLWVRGQFNLDTQRGKEAFSDLAFGTIDEFSVGIRVIKVLFNEETGVIDLVGGEWLEWSPVLLGMNPETALLNVKNDAVTQSSQAAKEANAPLRAAALELGLSPFLLDHYFLSDVFDAARLETLSAAAADDTKADEADDEKALSGSFEDIAEQVRALALEALRSALGYDGMGYGPSGYVVATFTGHCIVCAWDREGAMRYWDVPYVRDSSGGETDGQITIGTLTEVEMTYVPKGDAGEVNLLSLEFLSDQAARYGPDAAAAATTDDDDDAGVMPATTERSSEPFTIQAGRVLEGLEGVGSLAQRARGLADLRAKEGRTVSGATRALLTRVLDARGPMGDAFVALETFLEETDPDKDAKSVREAYIRYLAMRASEIAGDVL